MGYLSIFIGLIFICGPNMHVIDLLPDFIGWILIMIGLSRTAFTDSRFYEARRKAGLAALVTFFRVASLALVTMGDSTLLLLLAFGFGAGEIYLWLSFAADFFDGTEYMLSKTSCRAISLLSGARFMLSAFFVSKQVLCVIPEFITLFDPASSGDFSPQYAITVGGFDSLRSISRAFSFIVILAFGIYTLVKVYPFFKALAKDAEFNSILSELYREKYSSDPAYRLKYHFTGGLKLFLISLVFLSRYYADAVNIVPGAVFFIIMLFAFRRFARIGKIPTVSFIASAVGIPVSVGASLYQAHFAARGALLYPSAFALNPLAIVLGLAELILELAVIYGVFSIIGRVSGINATVSKIGIGPKSPYIVFTKIYFTLLCAANFIYYILPTTGTLYMTVLFALGLIGPLVFSRITTAVGSVDVWDSDKPMK